MRRRGPVPRPRAAACRAPDGRSAPTAASTDRRRQAGTGTAPRARETPRAAAARSAGVSAQNWVGSTRRSCELLDGAFGAARYALRFELGELALLRAMIEHDPADHRKQDQRRDR